MTTSFRTHGYAAARAPQRQRPRSGPVSVIRVLPALWEYALQAANGDGSRIRIISSTEVIVVNQGRRS